MVSNLHNVPDEEQSHPVRVPAEANGHTSRIDDSQWDNIDDSNIDEEGGR